MTIFDPNKRKRKKKRITREVINKIRFFDMGKDTVESEPIETSMGILRVFYSKPFVSIRGLDGVILWENAYQSKNVALQQAKKKLRQFGANLPALPRRKRGQSNNTENV